MKMSYLLVVCAVLVGSLIACPSVAQTVSGAGTKSCRGFLQAAEMESTAAIDSYISWSQGFVSGYNWANPGRQEVRLDHAGLLHWLLQYCNANPTDKFFQAVQAAIQLHAR